MHKVIIKITVILKCNNHWLEGWYFLTNKINLIIEYLKLLHNAIQYTNLKLYNASPLLFNWIFWNNKKYKNKNST